MLAIASSALALAPALTIPQGDAKPIDLKVSSAIVYQTGLVMLTRSAPIERGRAKYRISYVPEAAQGSLWYGVSDGATTGDVVTRLRFVPRTETFSLNSPAQLIAANVGKKVRFWHSAYGSRKERVDGVIEYVRPAAESQAGVRLPDGTLKTFNPFQVIELDTRGLVTKVNVKTRVPERTIELDVDAERPAQLWLLSLERGAAWAGSYAVETKEDGPATFVFKLQLALGALKFDESDVRLLAGSPRLPDSMRTDLASGAASFADLFGAKRQGPDMNVFTELRDPYDEIGKVLRERQALIAEATYAGYSQYRGGFGGGGLGGGGFGGGGIDFMSYDPTDNSIVNRPDFAGAQFKPAPEAPQELLDLISYPMGRMTLEPGDRVSRVQQKAALRCDPVVRWNLDFVVSPDYSGSIGRHIRIPNESALHWVPGPCLVSHLGTPVALSTMPLTPPKENAYVRVADAENILHRRQIKEISRKQIISNRYEITAEYLYTLGNTTSNAVEFEIAQEIEGKVVEAPDAQVRAINPFRVPNPIYRVEWRMKLAPGETREFKLTYSHRQV